MSFISRYIKDNKLDQIDDYILDRLKDIEKQVELRDIALVSTGKSFEDLMQGQLDKIVDLLQRFREHFKNWNFSINGVASSFKFVFNLATEIYQIVEQTFSEVVNDNMSENEKKKAKFEFGKELIWFFWRVIGPLDNRLKWIPFKKYLEKKVVLWLGGLGLQAAFDLFAVQKSGVTAFSTNSYIKAF